MNPLLFHVLDLLAKSAGILFLAFAVQSLWRGASAAQRSSVWLAAFLVLLLLPLTLLWQPRWSFDFAHLEAGQTLPPQPGLIVAGQASASFAAQALPSAPQPWFSSLSLAQGCAVLWLAGFAGLLARRALGSLQLRRLKSRSHAVVDACALAATARVADALGVRCGVSLRESASISVPLTWGFLRPVLLLPSSALNWNEARLEAALRHEMGHIRHCDAFARLIATFITAFYWPNVLVWRAARSWCLAQEQAADDLVMSSGTVAENYALQLLEAARGVQEAGGLRSPALAMAQPSTLETRLSAIMDEGRNRRSYSIRGVAAVLAFAAGMLALCASAQLRAADEKPGQAAAAGGGLKTKAQKLIVPKMILKEASLEQAVAFLRQEAATLDPEHAGLNIMVKDPDYHKDVEISLDLRNVPVSEALHYVASLSERVVLYEPHGIIISPKTAAGQQVTRSYKLPAGALAKIGNAREWLTSQGLVFEEGATAAVVAEGSQLLVRNTPAQQDVVEAIVSRIAAGDVVASTTAAPPATPLQGLEKKAAGIILPTVHFQQASLPEALDLLRAKAKEADPDKSGVSILIRAEDVPQNVIISMDLKNVPLTEALRYTASLAGLSVTAEPYAFILKPKTSGR